MPYDSNGNYTLPVSYFVENGDTVLPIQHNPPLEDIQGALSSVLLRSGVAPMSGDLKMGTKKITGMADGTSTTDGATKGQVDLASVKYAVKSANYTAGVSDNTAVHRYTGNYTVSLGAAATLGANWNYTIIADGGAVPIDPNAAETVNGLATFVVPMGVIATIYCDGTAFTTDITGQPAMPGYVNGLVMSRNASDSANDIDVAAGSAASDDATPRLIKLASAVTKRIDAAWAVGNNQGGLDTGSIADGTYYTYEIQRSDTGITDVLFSLSASAPTMPMNYDRKRRIGYVNRIGGVNAIVYSWSGSGLPFVTVGLAGVTAVDFPGIPADAKRITAIFSNVTMGGSNVLYSQLGTSGGVVSTGYVGGACGMNVGGTVGLSSYSIGMACVNSGASGTAQIIMEWDRSANNDWVGRSSSWQGQPVMGWSVSSIVLGGVLDRIRLSASNAMTSGNVTLMWE